MKFELNDRRVLVVGASTGIGRATAAMAAGAGARVAASARRGELLDELVGGGDAEVGIRADVRQETDCHRLVQDAVDGLGGLDALIYCVGVSPLKPLADATAEDWRAVLESNLVGAALVTAAAAPHLLESRGRAVLVSSKSVRRPFPDLALYTTSKIALDGLIKCLPVEFPGLQVTRAVVGNTADTDFATAWDPDAAMKSTEKWAASGVLGSAGMMHPNQVAEALLTAVAARGHIDDLAIIDRDIDQNVWD